MLFKLLLIAGLCRISGYNGAVSVRTGLILAHGGEFGFAILILAMDGGILETLEGQTVLAVMLFSMALAPILIRHNGLVTAGLLPHLVARSREEIRGKILDAANDLNRHVIVCGFGRVGQHTVNFLSEQHIPCMAIELDQQLVREGVRQSKPVSYGDGASLELLHACCLERASALVVSTIDFNTTIKILTRVRRAHPRLPVIVLTRKEGHLYQLYQAGASEVVADTFGIDQMVTAEIIRRYQLSLAEDDSPLI